MRHVRSTIVTVILLLSISVSALYAAEVKPAWQLEWDKTIEAAKQEGKVVAGIPASAELRKALNQTFSKRYPDIDIELATGRGPANASKIAAEHAAGVRYFDLLISGSLTPLSLLNAGILEPIEPLLILPEVKDPKRWYGGHVWADNAKKFLYSFQAYQSENFWHNTQLLKPDEYRGFATKVFVNWLLSKEGQETYGKAMGQATHRLDVDTQWLAAYGTRASKDFLSFEENQKRENSSEEVLTQLWPKAIKLANDLLK
jgi:ABC-type Fe3+ transport system substrate-binding protein